MPELRLHKDKSHFCGEEIGEEVLKCDSSKVLECGNAWAGSDLKDMLFSFHVRRSGLTPECADEATRSLRFPLQRDTSNARWKNQSGDYAIAPSPHSAGFASLIVNKDQSEFRLILDSIPAVAFGLTECGIRPADQ